MITGQALDFSKPVFMDFGLTGKPAPRNDHIPAFFRSRSGLGVDLQGARAYGPRRRSELILYDRHSKLSQDYVPAADAHLLTLPKTGGAAVTGKQKIASTYERAGIGGLEGRAFLCGVGRRSSCCYLALEGGFAVPPILGSAVAEALRRAEERRVAELVAAIEPVPGRNGVDLASLYGGNLISGVVSGVE